MADDPFVSIIMPVYNARRTIFDALSRLFDQDYPADRYEVIVVDDGSTDGSDELIRKFPVRFFRRNHKGASAARNEGLRQAAGEIVILLDSDCTVGRNWIRLHVDAQAAFEGQGCIGGSFDFPPKGTRFIELCEYYSCWYEQHPQCPPRMDYEYLPSTNFSFPRSFAESIGGFAEDLQTGEDVDFCQRLTHEGKKIIFQPHIAMYHIGRETLRDYLKHHYRWGKHAPTVRRWGSARRFHFLFRPSMGWALCMAFPIALGYTLYIVGLGLRYFPMRILMFFPMIFFAKIAYAIGVVKGTMALTRKGFTQK